MRIIRLVDIRDYDGADKVVVYPASFQDRCGLSIQMVYLRNLGVYLFEPSVRGAGVEVMTLNKSPRLDMETLRRFAVCLKKNKSGLGARAINWFANRARLPCGDRNLAWDYGVADVLLGQTIALFDPA